MASWQEIADGREIISGEAFVRADFGPNHLKENPVGMVDMGYQKEKYAPFCQTLLIKELGEHPLAFMCVRKIGMEAAQARMVVDDPDIQAVLDKPNTEHTGASFRQLVYMMMAGIGDCVVAKETDATGKLKELWVIRIDRMSIKYDRRGRVSEWTYRNNGKTIHFKPEDIMRVKQHWIDLDEFGKAPAYPMRSSLKYYDGYNAWNNQLLDGAQGVSEILALSGSADPVGDKVGSQIMDLLRQFKLSSQQGNVGGRVFLNAPVTSVSRGVNPEELQVTDWFDRLTKSILNGYGVPPTLLNIGEGITYENQQEARASFWDDTLIPLYANPLAEALSNFLGVKVTAELDNVPAIAQRRCDMMTKLDGVNFMTINEKRNAVGLGPVDGGDELFIDANRLPLGFGLPDDATERQIESAVESAARKRNITLVE